MGKWEASGFQFPFDLKFWCDLCKYSYEGHGLIWAIPHEPDGYNFYLFGVVKPSWKQFKLWFNESNCIIYGEDFDAITDVKSIIEKIKNNDYSWVRVDD